MRSYRYLITGMARAQIADALVEYRQFADAHPDDPLSESLLTVAREVRAGVREQRMIGRVIGEPGKANAHVPLSARDRRQLQRRRRERLAAKAAA